MTQQDELEKALREYEAQLQQEEPVVKEASVERIIELGAKISRFLEGDAKVTSTDYIMTQGLGLAWLELYAAGSDVTPAILIAESAIVSLIIAELAVIEKMKSIPDMAQTDEQRQKSQESSSRISQIMDRVRTNLAPAHSTT